MSRPGIDHAQRSELAEQPVLPPAESALHRAPQKETLREPEVFPDTEPTESETRRLGRGSGPEETGPNSITVRMRLSGVAQVGPSVPRAASSTKRYAPRSPTGGREPSCASSPRKPSGTSSSRRGRSAPTPCAGWSRRSTGLGSPSAAPHGGSTSGRPCRRTRPNERTSADAAGASRRAVDEDRPGGTRRDREDHRRRAAVRPRARRTATAWCSRPMPRK